MTQEVFVLPDLGEGLEDAVVSRWLVSEGAAVELNQPFVEIETAKAVVEVPAPFAGTISSFHVAEGQRLGVGAPLATFEVQAEASVHDQEPTSPVAATPAVRRLAKERGVELGSVRGTGSGGRITREDVERAARGAVDGATPVSVVRRAIASRLEEVARIPQVTTFRTVDCTALEEVRAGLGLSPLPIFVRALADVCRDHPMLNASWESDRTVMHRAVHVGIATDTDEGLIVPVLRDADSRGIAAIGAEIARLARAARSNALSVHEREGATITVTNTGSYGSEFGTPLLDPGHAVTIALGVIEPRALVVEGAVQVRPACTLSLTFDHRVLDGATVGRAFGALVALLGSSERLAALPR